MDEIAQLLTEKVGERGIAEKILQMTWRMEFQKSLQIIDDSQYILINDESIQLYIDGREWMYDSLLNVDGIMGRRERRERRENRAPVPPVPLNIRFRELLNYLIDDPLLPLNLRIVYRSLHFGVNHWKPLVAFTGSCVLFNISSQFYCTYHVTKSIFGLLF